MLEIENFNALICDADNKRIKLESFRQDDAGFFYASWRKTGVVGPELKRRLPFNALLDSYLALRDAGATPAPAVQNDLFG